MVSFFFCAAVSWLLHGRSQVMDGHFSWFVLTSMRFTLIYICLAIRYGGMPNTDLMWNGVLALVPIWENNKYVRHIVTVYLPIP